MPVTQENLTFTAEILFYPSDDTSYDRIEYNVAERIVAIGCKAMSPKEWLKHGPALARTHSRYQPVINAYRARMEEIVALDALLHGADAKDKSNGKSSTKRKPAKLKAKPAVKLTMKPKAKPVKKSAAKSKGAKSKGAKPAAKPLRPTPAKKTTGRRGPSYLY